MTTWQDFITAAKKRNLIRKSLDAVVLVDMAKGTIPTTILSSGALSIPVAYKPLGWHSDDGLSWAREVQNSDLTGHGSVDPVRSDVRSVTNTLEMTALETNILTLGLELGLNIDKTDGTDDEVVITEPSKPTSIEFRMLAVSVDDTDFGEIYFGKLFASAKVTATSPGAWTDGDSAQSHGLTIQAFRDATAGFGVQHYLGGPGFEGLRLAMGWSAAA